MPAMHVRLTFEVSSEQSVEKVFEAVADALFELDASNPTLLDADVAATVAKNLISLAIIGMGECIDAASANAVSAIRTAIHASGGATPGWDEEVSPLVQASVFKFVEQHSELAAISA